MKGKAKDYFTFVLHLHLPYVVGHGTGPQGMDWLCAATCETYLPLLNVLNRLVREGISPRVTLSLTPVLLEQLASPKFKGGLEEYIQFRLNVARDNRKDFLAKKEKLLARLASFWYDYYRDRLRDFKKRYCRDLVRAFRILQSKGHIEIMTSCATHGYLPLLGEDISVAAQIRAGVASYVKHFGQRPKGFWLPECGYRPGGGWVSSLEEQGKKVSRKGIDYFLSKNELKYFIVDTPMLKGGKTAGVYLERFQALEKLWCQSEKSCVVRPEPEEYSPYGVYYLRGAEEGKEVAVFTRDPVTAIPVWSAKHGYPGDAWYLDFHRKYSPGKLRYWRVTGAGTDPDSKLPYEPKKTKSRVRENAAQFIALVQSSLGDHYRQTRHRGLVCAPYNMELFGRWWFEGPEWLYAVLKGMSRHPEIELITCSRYLDDHRPDSIVELSEGSWGEGGSHWIWLNKWTRWVWKLVYQAEMEMKEIVRRASPFSDALKERLLKQLARELLLLESSDWAFLISTWGARDYAQDRAERHYQDFQRIAKMIKKSLEGKSVSDADLSFVTECEKRDNIFEEMDPDWWREADE